MTDREPTQCVQCYSTYLVDSTKSIDDGVVSECERKCGDCGCVLGYFAYGHWVSRKKKFEKFTAKMLLNMEDIEVTICEHDGSMMVVLGQGPLIINKQQAMAFFGLVEPENIGGAT